MKTAALIALGLLVIPAWLRFSFWWWSEMVYVPLVSAGMQPFAAEGLVTFVGAVVTLFLPALVGLANEEKLRKFWDG